MVDVLRDATVIVERYPEGIRDNWILAQAEGVYGGSGTGWMMTRSKNVYTIVTVAHNLIDQCLRLVPIKIRTRDGMYMDRVKIIGVDVWHDIGVIQASSAEDWPTLTMTDETSQVGNQLWGCGHASSNTMTRAFPFTVVSGIHNNTVQFPDIRYMAVTQYTPFYLTDLVMSAGTSGAPIVNKENTVVAMMQTTAGQAVFNLQNTITGTTLTFDRSLMTPSWIIQPVVDHLLQAYDGVPIEVRAHTALAFVTDIDIPRHVPTVMGTLEGSSLQFGDQVLEVDGTPVDHPQTFYAQLQRAQSSPIPMRVNRIQQGHYVQQILDVKLHDAYCFFRNIMPPPSRIFGPSS